MAQRLLRLRRALTPLSSTRQRPPLSTPIAIAPPAAQTPPIISQWRGFSGTRESMMSTTGIAVKQYKVYEDGNEIVKNTILFEGNEYIHWLVTVDFPKEPKPSTEEMVAAFERICAQGLNISIEEAKKRMYACSTTIYQGFQVSITHQEAEKFKGVPGVVFVSPDSRVIKENGGEKYKNGVITPRPPPVQFQRGGERRRDPGRIPPRFDQPESPIPNYQGPQPQYSQQGHMQGGGSNYGKGKIPGANFQRLQALPNAFDALNFSKCRAAILLNIAAKLHPRNGNNVFRSIDSGSVKGFPNSTQEAVAQVRTSFMQYLLTLTSLCF
ncbi:hypothetical protein D5086_009506 [Populus alba]|uniref:Uncharacterized protein n=1 Tax=Populus alba TaxID=43335 RepID=A0ACC4CIJ3_POPAL